MRERMNNVSGGSAIDWVLVLCDRGGYGGACGRKLKGARSRRWWRELRLLLRVHLIQLRDERREDVRRAWLQVLGYCCACLGTLGVQYSFSMLYAELLEDVRCIA